MKVFIVAEAGVNHNGRFQTAKKLIDAAQKAGADAIKFQTFKAEEVVSPKALLASYQKKSFPKEKNQFKLIKKLEFSFESFKKLSDYCRKKSIMFLSTPFDYQSVDFLQAVRVPLFKISSGELTNIPFLKYVAEKKKRVILSTGMSDIEEVKQAVDAIYSTGNKDLVLLHCVTDYPASFEDVNLRVMETLRKVFKVPVGYSDHTAGIEIAVAAASLGASVIEKHLTLRRTMKGPDHQASLEPNEFAQMVTAIRRVEKALGNGVKRPTESELKNIPVVRRSVIAAGNIVKGKPITPSDVVIKRPGYGIQPKDLEGLIGRRAVRNIKKDDVITWACVEKKEKSAS